ncbi:thiamine-monophosphate kinase, partial [Candidatus Omnitrophota bacterium]
MKELELVARIRKRAGRPGKGVKVGIGDDCAVLEHDAKRYLLWATDMLVEGTHFRLKDAGYDRIGRKAVAVNISDIAAMGGVPRYITVAVGLPAGMKRAVFDAIYGGILSICKEYGIEVVGGDINRSERLIIDISIIGFVEKKRLTKRSGAKEGQLILVTGPVRNGKKEHLDFTPRLEEARFLTERRGVSSMIDVSDGIAMDLGRICSESGVGCILYADAVPLSEGLSLEDALYYGESFELLFTMGTKKARELFLYMKRRRETPGYFVIGEITPKKNGLRLIGKEGHASVLKAEGFR